MKLDAHRARARACTSGCVCDQTNDEEACGGHRARTSQETPSTQ